MSDETKKGAEAVPTRDAVDRAWDRFTAAVRGVPGLSPEHADRLVLLAATVIQKMGAASFEEGSRRVLRALEERLRGLAVEAEVAVRGRAVAAALVQMDPAVLSRVMQKIAEDPEFAEAKPPVAGAPREKPE